LAFEDYEKVADPLILPIAGKKYRIPEIGIADGIKFNLDAEKLAQAVEARKTNPDAPVPAPMDDEAFLRMFLGAAYDEMVANNVPGQAMVRAAMTSLTDFQKGRGMAEIMWATGGDPKAVERYLTPNRATRRSTSSGAGKKTPRPASTSGTTSELSEQPQGVSSGLN
jgi:hypothetical protein